MFKDFQIKMISKDVSGACKFTKKEILALWLRTPFYIEHLRWLLLTIQFSPLNH